jgi:lipopolysaccharide transport system ATP-binding protein
MSDIVLRTENISKQYRLGQLGTGTISHDLNRAWARMRGKEDPYLKVGDVNDRSVAGGSDYVWSLKDINFEVKKGEVLGVIGKNGAGKSTLLKILSQVTTPTTGRVKVKGRIAALLEVGTGFHPDLSGRENIFLNGAILGMTKAEIRSKLDEIVEFSGVAKYLDTPVKRYSSGMMVRLGFAIAAHLEPEILIVDEVLAVGDAEFQKKCLGKMKDVAGQGRTVLFVSHNMAAVRTLCTKGLVLESGRIKYTGSSNDAVQFYTQAVSSQLEKAFNDRDARAGDGRVRVTDFKLINEVGEEIQSVFVGASCKMRFYFKKNQEVNMKHLCFLIQFKNEYDDTVTTIATDEMGIMFPEMKSEGYFEVEIPKVIFREGRYVIHYLISEKASFAADHNPIDSMNDAAVLNVLPTDYWGVGSFIRPRGFLQEASIKLINH